MFVAYLSSYPACNAHAPYCHLCPAPLYNIFPHYLINGIIFEKKKKRVTEHKMRFDFLHIFGETFRILQIMRDMYIGIPVKYALFLSVLIKLDFSRQIFEKHSNIKFRRFGSSCCPI